MGTTDIATGMATGEIWFKVPAAIQFVLTGKPGKYVSGKDIIIPVSYTHLDVYKRQVFSDLMYGVGFLLWAQEKIFWILKISW